MSTRKVYEDACTHLEHFKQILLLHHQALEPLLLLYGVLRKRFESGIIRRRDGPFHGHLVVEALVKRRTKAQMATVVLFRGLAEHMGGRVPEYALA